MTFMLDRLVLKAGLVIYHRADVKHRNWYCRVRIRDQDRYKPISLKTSDVNLAKERAFDHEAELRFKLKHGLPVFEQPFSDLAKAYLKRQKERADVGEITLDRWRTAESIVRLQLNPYLGSKNATQISDKDWSGYAAWRISTGKGRHGGRVTNSAIITEMSILRAIVRFGQDEKVIPEGRVFTTKVRLKAERRDAFSPEEYRRLYTFARSWIKKTGHPMFKWYRSVVYLFILVMTNTGMRPSEARNLRWRDFSMRADKEKREYTVLSVRGKGKSRQLVAGPNVGEYLERIRAISKATGSDDFIFTDYHGEETQTLYNTTIEAILKESGLLIGESGSWRSTYSFRHTYATFRLTEGVDSLFLSKQMGTSVAMLEKYYGHITPVKNAERILQGLPGWESLKDASPG
jgi:integrase